MNFTEFVNAMKQQVTEQMEPGITVESYTAIKNNGAKRQGLVIIASGVNISPTIYLEEFYEQYQGGKSMPSLAQEIKDLYEKIRIQRSCPYEHMFSYQKLKDKIVYKLIREETNRELLKNVPWEKFLDFAKVYYALIENEAFGSAFMQIKKEHLRDWKVTEEDIRLAAERNTPVCLPDKVVSMTDCMYILTNQSQSFGAAAMCYPGTLRRVGEQIGEDYYLIPSSVHECVLVPKRCGMDREQLERMLVEINKTEVAQEDVLSERVYYYSREEGKLV